MKRNIIIYIVIAILAIGGTAFSIMATNKEVSSIKTETSNVDTLNVKTFAYEFKGHKYIRFTSENDSWCVHDPDCKCQDEMLRTKLNNITTVITNDTRKRLNNVEVRLNQKIEAQNNKLSNIEKKVQPRTIVKTRTVTVYKKKK